MYDCSPKIQGFKVLSSFDFFTVQIFSTCFVNSGYQFSSYSTSHPPTYSCVYFYLLPGRTFIVSFLRFEEIFRCATYLLRCFIVNIRLASFNLNELEHSFVTLSCIIRIAIVEFENRTVKSICKVSYTTSDLLVANWMKSNVNSQSEQFLLRTFVTVARLPVELVQRITD